jgi:hypothetical protein
MFQLFKKQGRGIKGYLSYDTLEDEVLQRDHELADNIIDDELKILGAKTTEILKDYIKGPEPEVFFEWFKDSAEEKELLPNKIRIVLGKALRLISFLDYFSYLNHPNSPCAQYHSRRMHRSNHPQTVESKCRLLMSTKAVLYLIPQTGAFFDNPNSIRWQTPTVEAVKEYLNSDNHWTLQESAEFDMAFKSSLTKKANTISRPGSFISTCLEHLGLQSKPTRKRSRKTAQGNCIDIDALRHQLKVAKGLLHPDHWHHIAESYTSETWAFNKSTPFFSPSHLLMLMPVTQYLGS